MRVCLPKFVYNFFLILVATIGIMGCMLGSTAGIVQGGVLLVYSGWGCCMRLQYS
jgi:hypothetical protein